jgi:hypothetical protein
MAPLLGAKYCSNGDITDKIRNEKWVFSTRSDDCWFATIYMGWNWYVMNQLRIQIQNQIQILVSTTMQGVVLMMNRSAYAVFVSLLLKIIVHDHRW